MRTSNDHRDRVRAGGAALAVLLALGWVLILGLRVPVPGVVSNGLKLFRVVPPPTPPAPAPRPRPAAAPRRAGAAAPPNLLHRATEVTAPVPVIRIVEPPPLVTAPRPNDGAEAQQGAAPLAGPGTGAGGAGDGFGSGNGGDGDGGGGGGSPLRQIGGRISGRDYPRDLLRAGLGGTVWVRYVVGTNGRVGECRIARSSGYPELDETTCRLIVERFRFKPKRDASGRKVPGVVVEDHRWVVDEPPPEDDR